MKPKLTLAQRRALHNLVAGRPVNSGLVGMSEHGGLQSTLSALRRRRLIDGDERLTPAGREAIYSDTARRTGRSQ